MKQGIFTVLQNRPLTADVWEMRLGGDTDAITAPGQFVNITVPGLFLRRPISVCDCEEGELTLVYKVVGKGTDALSRLTEGEELDLLTGLGTGYDLTAAGENPLLLGGGVGVPPLYWLAKKLTSAGKQVSVVLGFNRREEVFCEEAFRALGAKVAVTTVDGSYGTRGFVTDALPRNYTSVYTCGPLPMLKAVYKATRGPAFFSFEERMGCGFGACMGCTQRTKEGYKRICKDGPVLRREEILWED